jgi:hypothetical protein
MVMIHVSVKPSDRVDVTGFLGNPELRKSFQGSVYGCSRYTGASIFDILVYLIDGRTRIKG